MDPMEFPSKGVRWSAGQWGVLVAMAVFLLTIGGALTLIVRSGTLRSIDVVATALAGPTPTATPPSLVPDAIPTLTGLYWPAQPQPLATPSAGALLWWDSRFAYRVPVLLDSVAAEAPAGTWARVIWDGEGAQQAGRMRADGADLRVLAWDGARWWEIPRRAQPRTEKRGWDVLFHLQDPEIARRGGYYLYHGNPAADGPPVAEDAPNTSRLVLALGDRESVEWGPEVLWSANSPQPQELVSADGRVVITCPPGAPREDVRVRLRTVPLVERTGRGPLPDWELHADPAPGPPGPSNVAHWDPPLTVTINWAGLQATVADLRGWVHFAYEERTATWRSVPVQANAEQGLVRVTTDQP